MTPASADPRPVDVLLAEDNDADALMLEEAVRDAGLRWNIERVRDGAPAIERLRDGRPPHLVVVDLAMPRVRGERVLQTARALETPRPKVAVLTGSPNADDERACRALGADLFAVKPARPEDYAALILELAACVAPRPGT